MMVLMDNLARIEEVAIALKDMYDAFSIEFYTDLGQENLKNLKHVEIGENENWRQVEPLVGQYVHFLRKLGVLQLNRLEYDLNFQYRIKAVTVVSTKIAYNYGKHRYVSKIINDLFGARIVLSGTEAQQERLDRLLQRLKDSQVISRYYTRHDGKYHATHCYFQSDNRYFPWELQIWDKKRELKNYSEHVRHEKERHMQEGID